MNIINFAKTELKVALTNFQCDLLILLENDPDAWQSKLKPTNHELRMALDIYSKWKERQSELVAC